MADSRSPEDRILVRDGRRHHRPAYSRAEFRIGLGILGVLAVILGWVAWRGAHPDPALFSTPTAGKRDVTVVESTGGDALGPGGTEESAGAGGAPAGTGAAAGAATGAAADRGPLPKDLVAAGWTESGVSTFGPENLYVKIDGREDFYKSFGFRRLWFVALQAADTAERTVDIEAYDLGEAANALGALSAEKPPDAAVEASDRGVVVLDRNALYVARGPYYIRAIGSEESPAVRGLLEHVRARLEAGLPGQALPWAWALFVGKMGMDPGAISFTAENAFSFGFAKDVWSARESDETELFVVATAGDAAAAALAGQYTAGFTEYGDAAGTSNGVSWAADRYLKTVSGARSTGRWVVGVYGAPDLATAEARLARLTEAVRGLPLETAP